MTERTYCVLAYYKFVQVDDPRALVKLHHQFFKGKDATGRIYLSEQGINGQMSAEKNVARDYMQWLWQHAAFAGIEFKIHLHNENVFPRMTVKYRKQLVAFDLPVDLSKQGTHISSKEWDEMLEKEDNRIIIDVRNQYEWEIGHFEGSTLPQCDLFRAFPKYTEQLKTQVDPQKTKIMMCCTGGIRCEVYSAYLKDQGFEEVYQLQGGIIKYGLEQEHKHWKGKLFVFDDRMAIPINPNEAEATAEILGKCHHCDVANDAYYNCANTDCNALFLCCKECLHKFQGCCQESCQKAPRTRPYHQDTVHKPFRRAHHYITQKTAEQQQVDDFSERELRNS